MKPYLLTYSALCADDTAEAILNDTNAVVTWVRPFPHGAILLSGLALADLSAVLHSRLGDTWFLLTEVGRGAADGWLPKNLWDYVNHQSGAPMPVLPPAPEVRSDSLAAYIQMRQFPLAEELRRRAQ